MSFTPECNIKIGKIRFKMVNEVVIKRSIFTIGDTATIKLPLSAYLRNATTGRLTRVKTSEQFKAGDPVVIQLGYNGELGTEFVGYVRRLNLRMPLEIECEDYIHPLRTENINKSWKSSTLGRILTDILAPAGLNVVEDIPDISITNFICQNQTALWALQKIKDTYGLTIYFTDEGKLYAGLAYTRSTGRVRFVTGKNVIKTDDLKWVNADDVKLQIKAVSMEPNGSRIEAVLGDTDGEVRTLYFYDVHSKSQLEQLARAEVGKYKYTGYRGAVNCFIRPQALPAMVAVLEDEQFPERSGRYYIETTEVRFSLQGARRKVTLGIKLS